MAVLRSAEREHVLGAYTVVGRLDRSDLIIPSEYVSGVHAVMQWQREGWKTRDLGSHNGTTVNGDALEPGQVRALSTGDVLTFGDDDERWVLVDDSAPEPMATTGSGRRAIGENGVLALPDPDNPTVVVYSKAEGQWRLECDEGERAVADGETVEVEGVRWSLELPFIVAPTQNAEISRSPTELKRSTLEVTRAVGGRVRVVVREQDCDCLLDVGAAGPIVAKLAEARAGDGDGWVDRNGLLDGLSMRGSHLNVLVYRLRQQFANAGLQDAPRIIERRGSALRLGASGVTYRDESSDQSAS